MWYQVENIGITDDNYSIMDNQRSYNGSKVSCNDTALP